MYNDISLFEEFCVELDAFVAGTNTPENYLDPAKFAGQELWDVRYVRESKQDKSAMTAEELTRLQNKERKQRADQLRKLVETMNMEEMEENGICVKLTSLLEKPVYMPTSENEDCDE